MWVPTTGLSLCRALKIRCSQYRLACVCHLFQNYIWHAVLRWGAVRLRRYGIACEVSAAWLFVFLLGFRRSGLHIMFQTCFEVEVTSVQWSSQLSLFPSKCLICWLHASCAYLTNIFNSSSLRKLTLMTWRCRQVFISVQSFFFSPWTFVHQECGITRWRMTFPRKFLPYHRRWRFPQTN